MLTGIVIKAMKRDLDELAEEYTHFFKNNEKLRTQIAKDFYELAKHYNRLLRRLFPHIENSVFPRVIEKYIEERKNENWL